MTTNSRKKLPELERRNPKNFFEREMRGTIFVHTSGFEYKFESISTSHFTSWAMWFGNIDVDGFSRFRHAMAGSKQLFCYLGIVGKKRSDFITIPTFANHSIPIDCSIFILGVKYFCIRHRQPSI